jgi:hypothetical protein
MEYIQELEQHAPISVSDQDVEENLDIDFDDDDETVLKDLERLKNQAGITSATKHASAKLIGDLK